MSKYKNEREQQYEEIGKNFRKKALEHQEAKDLASESTQKIYHKVDGSTAYVVNFSDLHSPEGNMHAFMENLTKFAKIPNVLFIFGGDQINNSIKGSVGDTHGEILTPRQQIKLLSDIIKDVDKRYPVVEKIVAILSGNHENRTYKDVSEDPAYWLASELNKAERYVKNIALVEISLDKRVEQKNEALEAKVMGLQEAKQTSPKQVVTNLLAAHAEQVSGNPAAQAQHGLNSKIDSKVDIVTYGHNHKVFIASDIKQQINSNTGKVTQKEVTFINFGSYSGSSEYAERALYEYPRQSDMEILRITNTGQNYNKADMVNARTVIDEIIENRISDMENTFVKLEKTPFKTNEELQKAYLKEIKRLYKENTAKYKQDKKIKEEFANKNDVSDKIYFAPLSGFYIGDENAKATTKDIKAKVETLSKLNGSCKVVLSDLVFYKKAFTLTNKNGSMLGEKFPEESFSYILAAADLLKPIKDKIVAYNSGEQEQKIMKYHSEALAKMAMIRLQMDEKLCYEPYNEVKLKTEQLKIQAQQVEGYNKSVLDKEVEKAYKDLEKAVKDSLPYMNENYISMSTEAKNKELLKVLNKYNSLPEGIELDKGGKAKYDSAKNAKLDFLKKVLVARLRAEGKLLSLKEDKVLIDHKFPLEDIELRTPNEKLVQNIFCHLLGIDPASISINTEPNTNAHFISQVRDNTGKVRNVAFSGGSFKSVSGRQRIDGYLKGKSSLVSGANVYYTNAKSGKEFVALDVKKDGDKLIDTIFISGGSFGTGAEGQVSANKIYKLFATAPKNEKKKSLGIYANLEKDFNLHCESLNYETVLYEEDIFSDIVKNLSKASYERAFDAYKVRKAAEKEQEFDGKLKNIFTASQTTKAKPKAKKTTKKAEQSKELV